MDVIIVLLAMEYYMLPKEGEIINTYLKFINNELDVKEVCFKNLHKYEQMWLKHVVLRCYIVDYRTPKEIENRIEYPEKVIYNKK